MAVTISEEVKQRGLKTLRPGTGARRSHMRLSIANDCRHHMVMSQEDIRGTFPRQLADDCDDPALFKQLAGFNDRFPYAEQSQAVPILGRA